MKYKFILVVIAGLFFILSISSGGESAENIQKDKKDDIPDFFFPKPLSTENFPCSRCHNYRAVNKNKRKLKEYHTNIDLKHADGERWCYDCHEGDKLRLSSGELIDYNKPYNLCKQCHGTIFRDWTAGIHGKRTGNWDGQKLYRLCVSCHDPHQPRFKPLEPKDAPVKPSDIKLINRG